MSGGKDSAEVVKFSDLFTKLKDWTDDDPDGLAALTKNDEKLLQLCLDVFMAAFLIEHDASLSRHLFARPVDPKFIRIWRDYEERYASILAEIDLFSSLGGLPAGEPSELSGAGEPPKLSGAGEPPKLSPADSRWKIADWEAAEQTSAIKQAIAFAELNARERDIWPEEQDDVLDKVERGVAAWNQLEGKVGLDVQGVFRRRALIPFVLVPRNVAAKHGSSENDFMFKNLQQAHDAFIFGSKHGALALMRSITEAVLRDHYKAEGIDLEARIRSVGNRLPGGEQTAASLHHLRNLANGILHLNEKKYKALPKDEANLEKEIVRLLFVLRTLIEGVK